VTPSFNQGIYIEETIQSVLNQGYPDVEHLIIDGGSTDSTLEVLERYRDRVAYVVSERDNGQSDALNKGFRRATGDILCWLNSDDRFAPGALLAVALAFDTHAADMVSGICEVHEDGLLHHRHISACEDGPLPLDVLLDLDTGWNTGQFFYQPEVFFSRDLWERAGAHVRTDCYYSMDYELWCRFAYAQARLHVIGSPLAYFRVHSAQKTADPSKFKAELLLVRERFVRERGIKIPVSQRPEARWDRVVKVAMVNDIGLRYGAGIAQGRIAAGIEMAGHEPKLFELTAYRSTDGRVNEDELMAEVIEWEPDLVIFGNLHSADRSSVRVVDELGRRYTCLWVTHDFWLFTGRCAYPGACTAYLTGCDERCPTPSEYPELAPERIAQAWQRKQSLLAASHAPVILANSKWSENIVNTALQRGFAPQGSQRQRVKSFRLGVPTTAYLRVPQAEARQGLDIDAASFVIAFSVSSLSDKRKGGTLLLQALRELRRSDVTLVLIGNQDQPIDVAGVCVVSLGYLNDTAMIAEALCASDVYVGPSTEETLGQVFMEAAILGVPSVGFDQSGVKDSIVDGVTGLRVPCSVPALRDALQRLYDDREYCRLLGGWAAIYSRNQFSIESSYRSLFHVWDQLGLVDRWQLPHRIGFSRGCEFVPNPAGQRVWRPEAGISVVEGPFPPEFPMRFHWCHGPRSTIRVHAVEPDRLRVRLSYYCPLFDMMTLLVGCKGRPQLVVTLYRTSGGALGSVEFTVESGSAWNSLSFEPDRRLPAGPEEPRELSFMIHGVDVLEADTQT
jgi:glycosyltransferase involved in cell wall biosynthesis